MANGSPVDEIVDTMFDMTPQEIEAAYNSNVRSVTDGLNGTTSPIGGGSLTDISGVDWERLGGIVALGATIGAIFPVIGSIIGAAIGLVIGIVWEVFEWLGGKSSVDDADLEAALRAETKDVFRPFDRIDYTKIDSINKGLADIMANVHVMRVHSYQHSGMGGKKVDAKTKAFHSTRYDYYGAMIDQVLQWQENPEIFLNNPTTSEEQGDRFYRGQRGNANVNTDTDTENESSGGGIFGTLIIAGLAKAMWG